MAAEAQIPIYTNLTDLYSSLGASLNHSVRWDNLAQEFVKRFGRKPTYIARAPGRVNLIGEHIDYPLFGVLPAAIERDILIAIAPRSRKETAKEDEEQHGPGGVVAENLHPKYTRQTFAPASKSSQEALPSEEQVHAEWQLDINKNELRWESYVKAGYYGVLNHYFSTSTAGTQSLPVPVDLLVTGSVPAGSGLSSSAAMVVASTLAFLAANEKLSPEAQSSYGMNKGELTRISMENEKRVGVNSGGMDQAASIISGPGEALYITFFPKLHADPVPLPKGAVFVCANSLVVADKAVGAKRGYNLRVVETLVGARVLGKYLKVEVGESEKVTYREVLGRWIGEKKGEEVSTEGLKEGLEKIVKELDVLKRKGAKEGGELGVTMEEMVQLTGMSKEAFDKVYLSWVEVEATHFQLYKRAKHVFTEALRVLQFREACLASQDSETLHTLGELMNQSQTSCNELYDCSCPELNTLTEVCRESGAVGSRLTGAGWGGCTVSLVPENQVEEFIKKVAKKYAPYEGLEGEKLSEVIFATRPSSGACVYKFTD